MIITCSGLVVLKVAGVVGKFCGTVCKLGPSDFWMGKSLDLVFSIRR